MKNAFDMIPDGLRDAAKIDGAGEMTVFWRVMMPTTWSSIATIFIYSAYTTWNDYLIAVVFANNEAIKTFNVGLTNMAIGQYGTEWGLLTAGSLIRIFTEVLYQRDARWSNQIDNGGKRRYEKNADDGDQGSDAPGLVKGATKNSGRRPFWEIA